MPPPGFYLEARRRWCPRRLHPMNQERRGSRNSACPEHWSSTDALCRDVGHRWAAWAWKARDTRGGGTFITILQNAPGHMTVTTEHPSRGQTPPHVLCCSSSLKHLDVSIWCSFLSCFKMRKPPPNGRLSLLEDHKRSSPQASGTLRIDHAGPLDTALSPRHQPVRELATHSALRLPCAHVLRRSVVSDSVRPHCLQLARPLCPWGSPGKNIRLGCQAPCFRGSSWLRDWTYVSCVSCTGRRILYH